jgi:tetratricopeptide (TPR) repeat protein
MTDAAAELQRMKGDFPGDAEVLLTEASLHETYAWPNLARSVPRPMVGFSSDREVKGHLAEAESKLREVLRLQPANSEARVRLAQVLRQQKREKEALDLLDEAVTRTEDPWLAYQARLLAGAAAEALRNPKLAVEHYRAAVQLQPGAPTALIALSHALRSTGDRAQALATALRVQQAGSDDPWWEYFCGQYRKLPARVEEMRQEVMR